ncbi:hypothetical protein AMTRI_Chr03g47190 [Amborella trichopoda]
MLNQKDLGVRIVGILGPKGIGKTTISNALYNLMAHFFDAASIMVNIRKSTSLIKPQNKDHKRVNVIRKRRKDKKMLVILDGVDSRDQIDALACMKECLHPGSRMIITCRENNQLINTTNMDEWEETLKEAMKLGLMVQ